MTAGPTPSPGRIARLPARRDFLRLQAAGRKQVTPGFILQLAPLPEAMDVQRTPRVGFTTSKKVGNAVARNRARRRLRALAREVLAPLAVPGFDFVLIGREATLQRDYAAMARDLKSALRRLQEARPQEAKT
jgi:ribonuclease P protein component